MEQRRHPLRSPRKCLQTSGRERAVWYGFLPEDAGDSDIPVTWAQFCSMLGKMIAQYDQSKLEQWEKETADAPNEKMRRDGGMVALLFAAKTMGLDSFNARASEYFSEYAPRVWDVVTMGLSSLFLGHSHRSGRWLFRQQSCGTSLRLLFAGGFYGQ